MPLVGQQCRFSWDTLVLPSYWLSPPFSEQNRRDNIWNCLFINRKVEWPKQNHQPHNPPWCSKGDSEENVLAVVHCLIHINDASANNDNGDVFIHQGTDKILIHHEFKKLKYELFCSSLGASPWGRWWPHHLHFLGIWGATEHSMIDNFPGRNNHVWWMWDAVWKDPLPQPWPGGILHTSSPRISANSHKSGEIRVVKMVSVWVCIYVIINNSWRCSTALYIYKIDLGCSLKSSTASSLNHGVVASFAHLHDLGFQFQSTLPNLGKWL